MRIEQILSSDYSPRLSLHFDDVKEEDINEVSGMLRGLMCAIDGWGVISVLDNERFTGPGPLVLKFRSADSADYFKQCVDYYFSEDILTGLRVLKRVYRAKPS